MSKKSSVIFPALAHIILSLIVCDSRSDLLVRVRYVNPLPGPPFPPKLFSIPTNIHRLGDPAFLDEYAASIPIPMLVDSEMGMPVDLNAHDWMWYADEGGRQIQPSKTRN